MSDSDAEINENEENVENVFELEVVDDESSDVSYYDKDYIFDYPEECDNPECKRQCYTTVNIKCDKCGISNEFMKDDIYHCLDCMGHDKKIKIDSPYVEEKYNYAHGFDMCKNCYLEFPTFIKNFHTTSHIMKLVTRRETIFQCGLCEYYFCTRCISISNTPIKLADWLAQYDDNPKETVQCVCDKCLLTMGCPYLRQQAKKTILSIDVIPPEIQEIITDYL